MRLFALDIGDKRIGIAVSDPLRITAQGLETYTRADDEKDAAFFAKLTAQYTPEKLIVGLPRNMNGTYGPQAEKVKEYAVWLAKALNIDIVYWDERLSTVSAQSVLIEGNVRREKRKLVVDKVAAAVILQNYLDFIARKEKTNGQ